MKKMEVSEIRSVVEAMSEITDSYGLHPAYFTAIASCCKGGWNLVFQCKADDKVVMAVKAKRGDGARVYKSLDALINTVDSIRNGMNITIIGRPQ